MEANGSGKEKSQSAGAKRRKIANMVRYLNAFPNDPHFQFYQRGFGDDNEDDGAPVAANPLEWAEDENIQEEQLTEHMRADDDCGNDEVIEARSEGGKKILQEQNSNEETVVQQPVDDSDELGIRDADELSMRDADELSMRDADEVSMRDPDELDIHDADGGSDEELGPDVNEFLPFFGTNEHLRIPAFSKPHITIHDHLVAIIATSVRHNMTYENTLTILRWINSTLVDKGLPTTKNALWTALNRNTSCIKTHWNCSLCSGKIGEDDEDLTQCPCGKCGTNNNRPGNFLQINLRAQLQQLLSIPNIAQELSYRYTRSKENEDALEDLYDGTEYKKLCLTEQFLSNKWNFSFTINTDGCSVSNSSHASAWPVYVQLNELSPHARKKHMLLPGVWVDKGHPAANVFLGPIVTELEDLYSNGIIWKPDGQVETVSKFVTLICTVDSIARPLILRMTQFNGDYGCTFCYTEGQREVGKPGCKTYPVDKHCTLRTDEQLRVHMIQASESHDNKVFRVQGTSCLTALPEFDLCKGVVVDSMHNVFLGVTKQHTEQLINDTHSSWYVGTPTQLKIIDERLLSIKPPSRISRRPRSISTYHRQWKASEWRNWLLYYSLPCLEEILPSRYLKHLGLLVQAIRTLNSNSISARVLSESTQLLIEYVQQFQDLFGVERMTFNVHLLTHLSETVSSWGPLWRTTTFPFESWNHRILKTVTSSTGRANQIVTRFLMSKFVDNVIYDNSASDETKSFVAKLMHSIEYEDNEARVSRKFIGLGKSKVQVPSDGQVFALKNEGYECGLLTRFTKTTVNGIEYRCSGVRTTTLFCNSTVFTKSIGFAEVVDIVQLEYEGRIINGLFLNPYKSSGDAFGMKCSQKVTKSRNIVFVEVSDLHGPAITVKTPENLYAVKLANCWESD